MTTKSDQTRPSLNKLTPRHPRANQTKYQAHPTSGSMDRCHYEQPIKTHRSAKILLNRTPNQTINHAVKLSACDFHGSIKKVVQSTLQGRIGASNALRLRTTPPHRIETPVVFCRRRRGQPREPVADEHIAHRRQKGTIAAASKATQEANVIIIL